MVPNRTKHHIFSTVEGIHHSSLLNNVTHRPQVFYKEIASILQGPILGQPLNDSFL